MEDVGYKVIVIVVGVFTCFATAVPPLYQATGVLQPEARSTDNYDNIASSAIDVLPEITDAFQKIIADPGRSNPSDPAFAARVFTAFMPISKKILIASASAEGRAVKPKELEALDATEDVILAVFKFMETLKANNVVETGFNSRGTSEISSAATFQSQPSSVKPIFHAESVVPELQISEQPDIKGLGQYENIVASTVDILPEIANVLQQINSDPTRSDPSNPEFIQNVIMSFLPISRKILLASVKAEGRAVRQDDLDRLSAAEAVMPSVFQFMERLRMVNFFDTGTAPDSRTRISPIGQDYPSALQPTVSVNGMKPSISEIPVPVITTNAFQPPNPVPSVAIPYRYQDPKPFSPSPFQSPRTVTSTTTPTYPAPPGVLLPQIIRNYYPAPPIARGYAYLYSEDSGSMESSEEE